jgi:dephospho-CoA kinase
VKRKPLLLGITGTFGSGKSTASDFLTTKGFTRITLSSYLVQEIRKRTKAKITRKLLQDEGDSMRAKYGSGVLSKKALEQIEKEQLKYVVIDGIRNIGEVEALCVNPHFVLLAIVVDRSVRFERLQKDPRLEKIDIKSFTRLDYRDLGVGEQDTGLQVGMCIALADIYIDNGTLEDFKKKLLKIVQKAE